MIGSNSIATDDFTLVHGECRLQTMKDICYWIECEIARKCVNDWKKIVSVWLNWLGVNFWLIESDWL